MRFPAWYSLIVGVGMIGQWTVSVASGQVPELRTAPLAIAFHLVAEATTAVLLIVAGVALLRDQPWASKLGLVASGMLIYTAIVSPGYFANLGQWPFVGMFAVVLALAVVSTVMLFRRQPGATG